MMFVANHGSCPNHRYSSEMSVATLTELKTALSTNTSVCVCITNSIVVTETVVIAADKDVLLYGGMVGIALDGDETNQIMTSTGNLTIENIVFKNGHVVGNGGAISTSGGTLTLTNVIFTGSYAIYGNAGCGGAIYATSTVVTIQGCTFTGNHGNYYGGAIYLERGSLSGSASAATITNSTFSDNYSTYDVTAVCFGGAISSSMDLRVEGSFFSKNNAGGEVNNVGNGGAIHFTTGNLTVVDTIFSENTASYGAAVWFDGDVFITNQSSFFRNVAHSESEGSDIFMQTGFLSCPDTADSVICTDSSVSALAIVGGPAASICYVCGLCNPGKYSTKNDNGFNCYDCPSGKTSNLGASTCNNCAAGKHATAPGSAQCNICGLGKYSDTGGVVVDCTACPENTFNADNATSAFYHDSINSCEPCSPGATSVAGTTTSCIVCSPGKYAGKSSCDSCPAGTFTSTSASTVCLFCNIGTYNVNVGSSSSNDCTPCTFGFTTKNVKSVSSADCVSLTVVSYNNSSTSLISITPTALGVIGLILLQVIAGLGAFAVNMRKGTHAVRIHHFKGATVMALLSGEWFTTVVVILHLFDNPDFVIYGILLIISRSIQMIICTFILALVFGSDSMRRRSDLSELLDNKHMAQKSKLYALISIFVLININAVVMFPWRNSAFSRASQGLPNMSLLVLHRRLSIIMSVLSVSILIPYLLYQKSVGIGSIFAYINVISHLVYITAMCIEYFLLTNSICECTTAIEEDIKNGGVSTKTTDMDIDMRPSEIELGSSKKTTTITDDKCSSITMNPILSKSVVSSRQTGEIKRQLAVFMQEQEQKNADTSFILEKILAAQLAQVQAPEQEQEQEQEQTISDIAANLSTEIMRT